MGLINCPDCGNSVSDAAINCPKCGRPILNSKEEEIAKPKKKTSIVNLISVIIGIVFLLASIGNPSKEQSSVGLVIGLILVATGIFNRKK